MRGSLLLLFALAACADEPSFDEQFEKQSAEIEAEAKKLESDLKAQIELVPDANEAEKVKAPGEKAVE
jgi:hypothetical protein